MRNSILASMIAVLALLLAHAADAAAQGRRQIPEGFISEGIPKMPNPPGPAPKRDLSGAWVGPGVSNKPDPVPPMTPAGEAMFKQRKVYGAAPRASKDGPPGASSDPFNTCDPLGFPRNLIAHAITSRGGTLFGSAPDRILIGYEQQRVWREGAQLAVVDLVRAVRENQSHDQVDRLALHIVCRVVVIGVRLCTRRAEDHDQTDCDQTRYRDK